MCRTLIALLVVIVSPWSRAEPAAELTLLEQAWAAESGADGRSDPARAAELYRQAAEAGDAMASFQLGYLHEVGRGVPQDYAAARRYYQEAVTRGLAEARVRLAICHLEGWGGPQDRDAFAAELEQAAAAGVVAAQEILGSAYSLGIGVKRDHATAIHWLEQAARADSPTGQHGAGLLNEHFRGRAASLNRDIARTWYQLSAEQEYHTAMRAMARSLFEESAGARDRAEIRRWLELATESGDAESPFILAALEIMPSDGPSDVARGRTWIDLAAQRGNFRAVEVRDLVDSGRSLRDALTYVMSVPLEERYARLTQALAGDGPTRPPYVIKSIAPSYPPAAQLAGIEGTVTLQFIVDVTGRVAGVKAVNDPHPLLTDRAMVTVKQWRFAPGRKEGRPVATRLQMDFPFQLTQENLEGVDDLLAFARGEAERLGGEVAKDATDLGLARPVTPFPRLPRTQRGELPRKALLLLVLDQTGRPARGHVLNAAPESFGAVALEAALQVLYQAKREDGVAVPANVVLLVMPDHPLSSR